ncbi:MAG: cysteine desulfurase family protein [Gammaproteobacteria bacterium]|nr:cysteine desulfurase family protein [Gammaproteobacteria bacterium]
MPPAAPIYMDYAASAPVDPRVAERMGRLLLAGPHANPSAQHVGGTEAARLIAESAAQVGALVGLSGGEVIFTSGATESIGLGVIGAARYRSRHGRHVITGLSEHPAGLNSCLALRNEGFDVTCLEPDSRGVVTGEALRAALRPDTVLVSLMHVNNEIGVVQDVAEFGRLCAEHGAWLHVDAAQSAGRLPLNMRRQRIDLLSLTAHKMCGPKGAGALCINRERIPRIEPLLFGGGQQRSLRPGTLPTHQVAGLGVACEIAGKDMEKESQRVAALRERLWQRLRTVGGVVLNGAGADMAPGILSVSVEDVEGSSLVDALDGVVFSLGSACSRTQDEPSAVLRYLGRSPLLAGSTIRFSLGRFSTAQEIDQASEIFGRAVACLRALSDEKPALAAGPGCVTLGQAGRRNAGDWIRLEARWNGDEVVETAFRVLGPPILAAAARNGATALKSSGRRLAVDEWTARLNEELKPPPEARALLLCAREALQACLRGEDN